MYKHSTLIVNLLKIMMYIFLTAAFLFIIIVLINIYDYHGNNVLPWKEGDFFAVIFLNAGGAICSLLAALFVQLLKGKCETSNGKY